ncbi:acetyltransferase [Flavobacterium psychrophilum]|nr:acetyltransferase [Flavobacterium psychrophilum]AOE53717.1 acetyltransferase [Flavobacterium psychrophilum]
MPHNLTIEILQNEERKTVINGINSYNLSKAAALADVWTPVEFVAKNEVGEVIGGILGGIGYWNGLEIQILWVADDYRSKGIGKQLLQHAEDFATAKGATISILDTFDFQAEGFYLKNGYTPFGELNNFPNGHRRIYLSKTLNP